MSSKWFIKSSAVPRPKLWSREYGSQQTPPHRAYVYRQPGYHYGSYATWADFEEDRKPGITYHEILGGQVKPYFDLDLKKDPGCGGLLVTEAQVVEKLRNVCTRILFTKYNQQVSDAAFLFSSASRTEADGKTVMSIHLTIDTTMMEGRPTIVFENSRKHAKQFALQVKGLLLEGDHVDQLIATTLIDPLVYGNMKSLRCVGCVKAKTGGLGLLQLVDGINDGKLEFAAANDPRRPATHITNFDETTAIVLSFPADPIDSHDLDEDNDDDEEEETEHFELIRNWLEEAFPQIPSDEITSIRAKYEPGKDGKLKCYVCRTTCKICPMAPESTAEKPHEHRSNMQKITIYPPWAYRGCWKCFNKEIGNKLRVGVPPEIRSILFPRPESAPGDSPTDAPTPNTKRALDEIESDGENEESLWRWVRPTCNFTDSTDFSLPTDLTNHLGYSSVSTETYCPHAKKRHTKGDKYQSIFFMVNGTAVRWCMECLKDGTAPKEQQKIGAVKIPPRFRKLFPGIKFDTDNKKTRKEAGVTEKLSLVSVSASMYPRKPAVVDDDLKAINWRVDNQGTGWSMKSDSLLCIVSDLVHTSACGSVMVEQTGKMYSGYKHCSECAVRKPLKVGDSKRIVIQLNQQVNIQNNYNVVVEDKENRAFQVLRDLIWDDAKTHRYVREKGSIVVWAPVTVDGAELCYAYEPKYEDFGEYLNELFIDNEQWKSHVRNHQSLVSLLKLYNDRKFPFAKVEMNLMGFHNGVLNIETMKFVERKDWTQPVFCRKYFALDYNSAGGPTPAWDKMTSFQLDSEEKRFLEACCARTLFRTGSLDNWQFVPYIMGESNTGKSTIIEWLSYIHRKKESFTEGWQLTFGVAPFRDADIVLIEEVPPEMGKMIPQSLFQSMASGGEVSCRYKGQDQVSAPFTTPWFLCGNVPLDYEDKHGQVTRRLIVFPFRNSVAHSERDTTLKKKLEQDEVAFLLHRMLTTYHQLLKEYPTATIDIFAPKTLLDYRRELRVESNPFVQWLMNNGKYDESNADGTLLSVIKQKYNAYRVAERLPVLKSKLQPTDFTSVYSDWQVRRPAICASCKQKWSRLGVCCRHFKHSTGPEQVAFFAFV